MTSTPPGASISDSWVDLTGQASPIFPHSPRRITPVPFGGEQDYLRMLREAQRDSNRSSTKVSPISSALMSLSSTCRNTPSMSPKSPPNSPNPELASLAEELKDVYINAMAESESDVSWDWSSKPNIPTKDLKFGASSTNGSLSKNGRSRKSSGSSSSSTCRAARLQSPSQQQLHQLHAEEKPTKKQAHVAKLKKKKGGFFSKEVVYTLLLTNLLSILLGAGIGVWLSKRGGGGGSGKMLVQTMSSAI